MDVFLAGGIFVIAYGLIASERVDRTLIALLGGLLVVVLGIVDQEEAFAAIDFNVIFLLAGMMVLAGGLSKTGFFEFVAGYAIHFSRGQPFRLLLILSILTALLAAVLDNVTTVVLLTPVTLSIARTLKVNPFPYLISQIFASNIGGTATLIGDPPNILIGSAAGLDFGAFLVKPRSGGRRDHDCLRRDHVAGLWPEHGGRRRPPRHPGDRGSRRGHQGPTV